MKNLTTPLLTLALLVALICGYSYVVLRIESFIAAIADARGSARISGVQAEISKETGAFLVAVAPDSAELDAFVVKDSESLRIIDSVETAAKTANVDITISSVSVIPSDWKYHERIRLVVSGRASFQALSRFAATLEGIPEASRVENISLEAAANKTWFGKFTIDFVKEKAGVTIPAGPASTIPPRIDTASTTTSS